MSIHFEDTSVTSRLYLNNNNIGFIEDGSFDQIGGISDL